VNNAGTNFGSDFCNVSAGLHSHRSLAHIAHCSVDNVRAGPTHTNPGGATGDGAKPAGEKVFIVADSCRLTTSFLVLVLILDVSVAVVRFFTTQPEHQPHIRARSWNSPSALVCATLCNTLCAHTISQQSRRRPNTKTWCFVSTAPWFQRHLSPINPLFRRHCATCPHTGSARPRQLLRFVLRYRSVRTAALPGDV
jgi:hypothetical protein